MIVNPILCINTAKTGLLESYDQEISGFLDRNPGRDVRVRSEGSMRNLGRDVESVWRVETERQQTNNKQATDKERTNN